MKIYEFTLDINDKKNNFHLKETRNGTEGYYLSQKRFLNNFYHDISSCKLENIREDPKSLLQYIADQTGLTNQTRLTNGPTFVDGVFDLTGESKINLSKNEIGELIEELKGVYQSL